MPLPQSWRCRTRAPMIGVGGLKGRANDQAFGHMLGLEVLNRHSSYTRTGTSALYKDRTGALDMAGLW